MSNSLLSLWFYSAKAFVILISRMILNFSLLPIFFFFCTLFVQPQIICFFNKLWKWIISIDKIFAKIFGVVSSWNRRSKKAFVIQDSKYEEKNSIDIFENWMYNNFLNSFLTCLKENNFLSKIKINKTLDF